MSNPTLNLKLPVELRFKLDLHLFSDLEGRVPKGAYKDFFESRLIEFFGWETLDLRPYGLPSIVRGPTETIQQLKEALSCILPNS